MFGSLVVVVPFPYKEGNLFLRHCNHEHTIDASYLLHDVTVLSIAYMAFFKAPHPAAHRMINRLPTICQFLPYSALSLRQLEWATTTQRGPFHPKVVKSEYQSYVQFFQCPARLSSLPDYPKPSQAVPFYMCRVSMRYMFRQPCFGGKSGWQADVDGLYQAMG